MVDANLLFANVRVMMIAVETGALTAPATQERAKMSKLVLVKRYAAGTKFVEMGFGCLVDKVSQNGAATQSIMIAMVIPTKIAHAPMDRSDHVQMNVAVAKKSVSTDNLATVQPLNRDQRFAAIKSTKTAMVNLMTAVDVRRRERCASVSQHVARAQRSVMALDSPIVLRNPRAMRSVMVSTTTATGILIIN